MLFIFEAFAHILYVPKFRVQAQIIKEENTQHAHDVKATSFQRHCDAMASH